MATETLTEQKIKDRAARILQQAHDYIEAVGFDIMVYAPDAYYDEETGDLIEFDLKTMKGEPMCYIGTVRAFAGVNPEPGDDASAGDGEELRVALDTLDKIAKESLGVHWRETAEENAYPTGRYIEALGFQMRDKFREDYKPNLDKEREYALGILRKALTDIYS